MAKLYATRHEAIAQVVMTVLPLDSGHHRNIEAIFAETFAYDMKRGGWVQCATGDDFWTIIAKYGDFDSGDDF